MVVTSSSSWLLQPAFYLSIPYPILRLHLLSHLQVESQLVSRTCGPQYSILESKLPELLLLQALEWDRYTALQVK